MVMNTQSWKSCEGTFGEPDPFRLRYRRVLIDCVGEVVRQTGRGAIIDIDEALSRLASDLVEASDRKQFSRIAKEKIAALHEGNFARYRIRPGEYDDWENQKG